MSGHRVNDLVVGRVDPAVIVALMVAEAEVLKLQAAMACAVQPPKPRRLRDLSPLGR